MFKKLLRYYTPDRYWAMIGGILLVVIMWLDPPVSTRIIAATIVATGLLLNSRD